MRGVPPATGGSSGPEPRLLRGLSASASALLLRDWRASQNAWGTVRSIKKCERGWRIERPPPSQEPRSPAMEHDGSCRRAHSLLGGAGRPRGPRPFSPCALPALSGTSVSGVSAPGGVGGTEECGSPASTGAVWRRLLQDPTVRSRARSAGELPRCLSHPPSSRPCGALSSRVLGKQSSSCDLGEEINSQAFFGKGSLPVTGILSCLISRDFPEA